MPALFALSLLPLFATAQTPDSTVIKQVDSLIQVSRALTGKRDIEKALEVNAAAEKLALEKLGRETAAYGSSCHNHGRVLYFKGDYPEAEKWYLEAIAIREKALGKEHPDYAWSLNNLANVYSGMGNYEKAEPLYLESKTIWEKTLGKSHPDYALSLNNLASLYLKMGQYEKAEPWYLESKAIRAKTLGKTHPDYAWSLNNLGVLYKKMGQYEKAEPLYLESKAIWEKVLDKEHPGYAVTLNNLASLYTHMGQDEKAEPLYLESKATLEKILGKEHPNYAATLSNLGILYSKMGQYKKAEPLLIESKAISEKAFGKEHPDYAQSLDKLAVLYARMGNYEKAEPLLIESKAISEKVLGKEHPDYALILNNLASLYFYMGQYEKAEPLYLESKTIREKVLGKEHPDYALTLNILASLYFYMGQYEKAELYYLELSIVNRTLITKALHHLSEGELNNYLSTFSERQHQILSFTQLTSSEKVTPTCFDNSLFYKGFLLHSASQVKRLALSDSVSTEKYNRLKGYRRRLAAQYALSLVERDSTKVAELETWANDLEKDLTRTVAGFSEALRQVKWPEVQQALKPGEAAIEFVRYRFYEKKETDSTMYAALLLLPGNVPPQFIFLFEEKSLDSLLQTQGERKADYVNGLYTVAERGAKPLGRPQKSLYELLWQPIEKELTNTKAIYFSPSGLLHRINLGAVPINDEETLADRYRLVELGSTRQLVIPSEVKTGSQDAILFGGVQYEMDSTAIVAANVDLTAESVASSRGELSFTYADSTLRGGTWNYLKWTDKEVAALEPILKTAGIQASARKGFAATEESFKAIGVESNSPRILHVATHGFFFPDPQSAIRNPQSDEPVFKMSDHPMIRSGLILAGGNYAWQTGKPLKPDMDDGILTAYEISQMNLTNTELVVLSACETGLGDIQGNEGVYGLQRAFKIAGAKYLVMSLWQVPDQETSVFMAAFYKHWLEGKMTIPEAFRTTLKEMRERFINPYQWAGFVLVE